MDSYGPTEKSLTNGLKNSIIESIEIYQFLYNQKCQEADYLLDMLTYKQQQLKKLDK